MKMWSMPICLKSTTSSVRDMARVIISSSPSSNSSSSKKSFSSFIFRSRLSYFSFPPGGKATCIILLLIPIVNSADNLVRNLPTFISAFRHYGVSVFQRRSSFVCPPIKGTSTSGIRIEPSASCICSISAGKTLEVAKPEPLRV